MLDYGSMGQNFYNAGVAVGKQAIKYLPNGGKVAIVTCCAGNIPLGQRAQGTTDAFKAAGNFIVVGPVLLGNDATQQYGAMEAMYQANPDIVGIFGTDASTEVIARFVEKNKLKGKVVGGGFDLLPATVEAVKKGEMAFTTTQNPFLWGYLSVHQLYLHRVYNLHPISIDSGAGVVTRPTSTRSTRVQLIPSANQRKGPAHRAGSPIFMELFVQNNTQSLAGKVAPVSGGSGWIGSGIARHLAAAGAKVRDCLPCQRRRRAKGTECDRGDRRHRHRGEGRHHE